jgi:uncharacterized protein
MKILFDINHPADVHFFKNAINILRENGHIILVTARDKDVSIALLNYYNIDYLLLSKLRKGLFYLALELITKEFKIGMLLRKYKIDICVSFTGACSVHAASLLGIPSFVFYDTETAKIQNWLTYPFASKIFTPASYVGDIGKNHYRFASVKELAYLHPDYFKPNSNILNKLGLMRSDKYIVFRFVSWEAAHDIGKRRLNIDSKRLIIDTLKEYCRIIIISEGDIDKEFTKYSFKGEPHEVHNLLYYATLYIGEGATMASECACLGTPAIYINPLKLGYIKEEQGYGLVFDLESDTEIINKAIEIILKYDELYWNELKGTFIKEHIDVTHFIVEEINKYSK